MDSLRPRRCTRLRGIRAGLVALLLLAVLSPAAPAWSLPTDVVWISEAFSNVPGPDDGREWIELFNSSASDVDLSDYSLGWGTFGYDDNTLDLSGILGPGQTFVIGGPTSDADNADPVFDLVADFDGNLPNPGLLSAGIGLFAGPASGIGTSTPVHALVYGGVFGNFFLEDETGTIGAPDAAAPAAGESLTFDGAGFGLVAFPTPGAFAMLPEPGSVPLVALGLLGLFLLGGRPCSSA